MARDATEPGDRALWSERIAERLTSLPEVDAADTILLFWSFGSEVDTLPAMERLAFAGKEIALPRIVGADLEPRSWRSGEPLNEASFGAMEPATGRLLQGSEIDVVITPGVAFDLRGYRVGYGAGFYDRLFARLRKVPRVAIAFQLQVVAGSLPRASFDLPVDVLVTEDGVVRFANDSTHR